MSPWLGRRRARRALVIGGGVAGLAAAGALAGGFDEVEVLERRRPTRQDARDHMVHGLLARGREQLEALFPGLDIELAACGAPLTNAGSEWLFHTPAGVAHRAPSRVAIRGFTRPLLLDALRRRVRAVGVRVDTGVTVQALVGDAQRVRGVRLDGGVRQATLVVDASGVASRCGTWLEALGYGLLPEEQVLAGVEYLSQVREPPQRAGWRGCYLMARPPGVMRSVLALPIEGERLHVGVADFSGRPSDPDDADGWVEGLSDPRIGRMLLTGRATGPVRRFSVRGSVRRRPLALPRWPGGLVLMGDAHCAPNPIYGQGMTVAALGAGALRDATDVGVDWTQPAVTRRVQRRLDDLTALPWQLATWQDRLRLAARARGLPLSTRLVGWWVDRGFSAATRDAGMRESLLEVLHLLRPVRSLLTPRMVLSGVLS